jgi:putative heme transporter
VQQTEKTQHTQKTSEGRTCRAARAGGGRLAPAARSALAVANPDGEPEPKDSGRAARLIEAGERRAQHPRWRRARMGISVALLAAAVAIMITRFGDIASAMRRVSTIGPGWVVLALAAEAGSMLTFARLQQRLFRAGGDRLPLSTMTSTTVAGNALNATLPGGVAWAAAWLFNQYGRRGVGRFNRVWVFLVAGGVSSFALFVIFAVGVEAAGSRGPVAWLRWPVLLLAVIPVLALVIESLHKTRPVRAGARWLGALLEHHLPGGARARQFVASFVSRFTAVQLRPLGWVTVLVLALLNWLLDCVVVVAALLALGVHVPWQAILVIYALTQITASFPITPGGVGIVAGSLAALLTAYGVPFASALAVVLIYRVLTFWIVVPLGWGLFGILEVTSRRRSIGHASAAPVPEAQASTRPPSTDGSGPVRPVGLATPSLGGLPRLQAVPSLPPGPPLPATPSLPADPRLRAARSPAEAERPVA